MVINKMYNQMNKELEFYYNFQQPFFRMKMYDFNSIKDRSDRKKGNHIIK